MVLDIMTLPLSSWSDLVRPSTSFDGQGSSLVDKLVDGRAKHDHDGVLQAQSETCVAAA